MGHFSLSLAKKPVTSLANLLTRLEKYINVEEVEMARQQLDCNQAKQPPGRDRPRNRPAFTPRGKYSTYEQLRAPLSEIMPQNLYRSPTKKEKITTTDKLKYCKFHKDYGQNTNDYITLKDEIESLIWRGS